MVLLPPSALAERVVYARDALPENAITSPAVFSALTDVPLFLGHISSFLLQGILVVQVFIYYVSFRSDSRYLRWLVFFVFIIETLSSVFATVAAITSIVQYGDLFDLSLLWAFRALAPLCGLAVLVVHLFYAWRIWVIGKSPILPCIIMVLSFASCTMVNISGFTSILGAGIGTEIMPELLTINILWLGGSAACDIIIATTLVMLFRKASRRVETQDTRMQLDTIMAFTVETGLVTALGAVIELMFFLVFRNSFIHFIMFYMLPKLYANCMMATLNVRLSIPGRRFRDLGETEAPINHVMEFRNATSTSASLQVLVIGNAEHRDSDESESEDIVSAYLDKKNDIEHGSASIEPLPMIPRSLPLLSPELSPEPQKSESEALASTAAVGIAL